MSCSPLLVSHLPPHFHPSRSPFLIPYPSALPRTPGVRCQAEIGNHRPVENRNQLLKFVIKVFGLNGASLRVISSSNDRWDNNRLIIQSESVFLSFEPVSKHVTGGYKERERAGLTVTAIERTGSRVFLCKVDHKKTEKCVRSYICKPVSAEIKLVPRYVYNSSVV